MTSTPESRLLELYDRISEAPDAIPRLRRFVLDLAVRGKLVEQDPNDEPAEELLKRIKAEKARLVKAGEIRTPKSTARIEPDDLPFDLPHSWLWVRLSEILTKLTDGTHHSPPNMSEGDFLYITAKNIKEDGVKLDNVSYVSSKVHEEIYARCNPEPGDILYIKDGATTGIVTVNNLEEPFSMLSSVALLKLPPCIFNQLVVLFLRSPFFYEQMRSFMKGAAITRVTLKRMGPALLPLPPLAEQHRIVAKVDELMALLDRLESARTARETTRNRLTTASLTRLTAPDTKPEDFPNHARFALDALPALTKRLDQLKTLRQTILNLAVRGKLVEQDPNEEPAEIEIKREDALGTNDGAFLLPNSWTWIDVNAVARTRLGKMLDKVKNKGRPRPYLRNLNVRWFDFDLSDLFEMPFEDAELGEFNLKRGDVLICEGGEPGRAAVWDERASGIYFQKAIHRVRFAEPVMPEFFVIALKSSADDGRLEENLTGTGIKHFTGRALRAFRFPLPPLAEQHRIVAKVDILMALCDRLEATILASDTIRSHLLENLLYEPLATAAESEPAIVVAYAR
jgi:type I restriction enzyme S subunit